MAEERIIPSVESVAEFRISINGSELPRTIDVMALHINKTVNRISSARFIVQDGDVATNDFVLSNGDIFLPGNKVTITAGSVDKQVAIFNGVIVKHSLSIRGNRSAQLVVDCRHQAMKATITRRSANYFSMADHEAIEQALLSSGLPSSAFDLAATTIIHEGMVQYHCTDWDFSISRAEQCGMLVLTNDEKIVMKRPDFAATAVLSLLYGASILELDAEMDSRTQYSTVKANSWDASTQELQEATGMESFMSLQGNITGAKLAEAAGQEDYTLKHAGILAAEELQAWADAQLLKSRMAMIRGRVKFEGIATIQPGDMLELHGLGNRFNGAAFVSGIRHDFTSAEGWRTQAQFGHTPDWFIEEPAISMPKAAGLVPGAIGLHTGIVTENEDPQGEFRVRVRIPFINANDEGIWARMAQADAGNNRGLFFRPEINDEVLVGFLSDDPRQPVILGMLHSSAIASPIAPSDSNHQKGYTSRSGMKFLFDDEKKEIDIETPGGNKIHISDDSKGISMEDQQGNKIEMGVTGIKISSTSAIEITATTALKLAGANLSMAGNAGLALSGGGSTKLESSGILELKGSIVMIN